MIFKAIPLFVVLLLCQVPSASGQQVLVEAEGFDVHGGWKLDTQFIQNMGSPFLLAHGLGKLRCVERRQCVLSFSWYSLSTLVCSTVI